MCVRAMHTLCSPFGKVLQMSMAAGSMDAVAAKSTAAGSVGVHSIHGGRLNGRMLQAVLH